MGGAVRWPVLPFCRHANLTEEKSFFFRCTLAESLRQRKRGMKKGAEEFRIQEKLKLGERKNNKGMNSLAKPNSGFTCFITI